MPEADNLAVISLPPTISEHDLITPIASGAYGEVWLARNAVGTLRAVKLVRRDRHASEELRRNAQEAVAGYFFDQAKPSAIRLHLVRDEV